MDKQHHDHSQRSGGTGNSMHHSSLPCATLDPGAKKSGQPTRARQALIGACGPPSLRRAASRSSMQCKMVDSRRGTVHETSRASSSTQSDAAQNPLGSTVDPGDGSCADPFPSKPPSCARGGGVEGAARTPGGCGWAGPDSFTPLSVEVGGVCSVPKEPIGQQARQILPIERIPDPGESWSRARQGPARSKDRGPCRSRSARPFGIEYLVGCVVHLVGFAGCMGMYECPYYDRLPSRTLDIDGSKCSVDIEAATLRIPFVPTKSRFLSVLR